MAVIICALCLRTERVPKVLFGNRGTVESTNNYGPRGTGEGTKNYGLRDAGQGKKIL